MGTASQRKCEGTADVVVGNKVLNEIMAPLKSEASSHFHGLQNLNCVSAGCNNTESTRTNNNNRVIF